jgi:hypothetical protein
MGRPEGPILPVGTKFGKFGDKVITAIRHVKRKNGNSLTRYYDWQCVCGGTGSSTSSRVERDKLISCKGCWATTYHVGEKHPSWGGYKKISGTVFAKLKTYAARRSLPFELTIEDVYEMFVKQNGRCILTGVEIKFPANCRDSGTASLDRIDSRLGYTKSNVQWVHRVVNFMKQTLSNEALVDWCRLVVAHADLK